MMLLLMRALAVSTLVIGISCVTMTTARRIAVPDKECFRFAIAEGDSLACECRGNLSDISVLPERSWLAWPGHTNTSTLLLRNIQRGMNGTNYTCVLQTRDRNITRTNYTLQVAFGPFNDNITVIGPDSFITDGTRQLNLTCSAVNAHPPPLIRWSSRIFECDWTMDDTCYYTPQVPRDDGAGVMCMAANPVFPPIVSAQTYFFLNLTYPPVKPLTITTGSTFASTEGQVLRSGNSLSCVAWGGKPFPSSIIFNCSNPTLHDQDDIVGDNSAWSSVIVDTSSAGADPMVCTCRAVWDPEPELFDNVTESLLYLEYEAKIDAFTINSTIELAVMEVDQATVIFDCHITARSDAIVTIRKQGMWRDLGVTENVTEVNGTEVAENRMLHTYTVQEARCEDTGIFTCSAFSGFFETTKESVRLTVSCGPRLYNGTVNPPPLLTKNGFVLHLVAYPSPQRVDYSFSINATHSLTQENRLLDVVCRAHDMVKYIAVCSFRRTNRLHATQYGVYRVSISNAFGTFHFRMNVNDADNQLTAAAAGLVAGLLSAFIIIIIIAVIALGLRDREDQSVRTKQLEDSEEDAEAGSGSGRDSLEEMSEDDPSIPFREVRPSDPVHPQQPRDHGDHGGKKSSTTLAEVVPRSSDVIFAVAEPKPFGEEPGAYYSYSSGKDDDYGDEGHPEAHTNPAWEDDEDDDDSSRAPYESGYMSIELSPGCKKHRKASSAGSEYALETKQRTFITKIFLPQQGGDSDGSPSERHGSSGGGEGHRHVLVGPHGDAYAKVRKTKGQEEGRGGSVSSVARERSTSADEESRLSCEDDQVSDLDDTEEEKSVSIDMDDEDSSGASTGGELYNDDVFKSGDESKTYTNTAAAAAAATTTTTPTLPPRKSGSVKEATKAKAHSGKEKQTKPSDSKAEPLKSADKKSKPPEVAPKPKLTGSADRKPPKYPGSAEKKQPQVVEAADRKPKLLETGEKKAKPKDAAAAATATAEQDDAPKPARVEGRRAKRNASGRAATTPIKDKADASGAEPTSAQPEEDNARNDQTEINQQQQQLQKTGGAPLAEGKNTNVAPDEDGGDPNPRPEPMKRKKKKLVKKTSQEPKDVEKGNILEVGDSWDELSEPIL